MLQHYPADFNNSKTEILKLKQSKVMKNKAKNYIPRRKNENTYRMKYILIISVFCFLLIQLPFNVFCQSKKISINVSNAAVEDFLKEVRKQSGMNYILNHEEVPRNIKINLKLRSVSVEKVLDEAFKDLPLDYQMKDNLIIIIPSKKDKHTKVIHKSEFYQTVRGSVIDSDTKLPLPGAVILIQSLDPVIGVSADENGIFRIEEVPLGRHNIQVSLIGYKTRIIHELLISSAKEVVLQIELKEDVSAVDEVIVKAYKNKDKPINSMSTVSTRTFSVEEAQRYAGGFDDPARLASAFAGVASGELNDNGIVIRGNAPKGLLWRLEGIEIPNPNHYAGLASIGGGGVSALSSLMLANSDFLTGAFPAEYGNALSGVFDIKLRIGNNETFEHTIQAGTMGVDISSEGPLFNKGKASYLFNYRYSTFALVQYVLPDYIPILKYQDLCFKLNFPTEKAGVFSVWALGYIDKQDPLINKDTLSWSKRSDQEYDDTYINMGVTGLNHKYIAGKKTYINTSVSLSTDYFKYNVKYYDFDLNLFDIRNIDHRNFNLRLTSVLNHKFKAKHINRSGFLINRYNYDSNLQFAPFLGSEMINLVDERGNTMQYNIFSQSKFSLSEHFILNFGFHGQYFHFNKEYVIEPRAGFSYKFSERQSLSLAYGKHSRLEPLNIYLSKQSTGENEQYLNKHLNVTKSHHIVFAYDFSINPDLRLKIEPYFQYLYDVPVIPDSSFSAINIHQDWFVKNKLENSGTGTNIGIDLTFERFLNDGYYWLLTASLFDSKYTGGDGIERNTKFNSKFVFNLLFGKEWMLGVRKNKILSISGRMNIVGGQWSSPVMDDYSYVQGDEVLYDDSQPFTYRRPHKYHLNISVNYRKNKKKHTSVWTLQVLNILGVPEHHGYVYDYKEGVVMPDDVVIIVPSISYKVEF